MSNHESPPRRRRSRARRTSASRRQSRHLKLVSDGWTEDLADLAVLPLPTASPSTDRGDLLGASADRDPPPEYGPPRPG
jgi:hypothetical protein